MRWSRQAFLVLQKRVEIAVRGRPGFVVDASKRGQTVLHEHVVKKMLSKTEAYSDDPDQSQAEMQAVLELGFVKKVKFVDGLVEKRIDPIIKDRDVDDMIICG